jgi:molybdopterin-binding protein
MLFQIQRNVELRKETLHMKLSARNVLKGTVVEISTGAVTSHVRLDVGGNIVTSSITNEAVKELGLKKGMTAYAVIKASDVMVAVD